MANADTLIDLGDLHQAIGSAIAAQFPTLKLVEFYREEQDRAPLSDAQLPAVLLELSEFEPAPSDNPGTEQLAVNARFEARVIMGFRTVHAKLEIRKLAAALSVFIDGKRWPHPTVEDKTLPTGAAEVTVMQPDNFDAELDRFEVWRVEWTQLLHLGESVWHDNDGIIPRPVYSWVPDIGFGHENDYREFGRNELVPQDYVEPPTQLNENTIVVDGAAS